MAQDPNNLIWTDLEMTGLDTQNDYIIEIATIVTDSQLNTLAEGPVLAIQQSEAIMKGMDDWNTKQHGRQYVPAGKSPMCGNSICQDRRFMARLMPELEDFFHYRNLDVSTIKELAARWQPSLNDGFKKGGAHLALDDIRESIKELQYFRTTFFK